MHFHILDLHFQGTDDTIAAFLVPIGNDEYALVEAGPHSTMPVLEEALAAHNVTISQVKHVFLTHIHFDHAGAAWAFARAGAIIYVHPVGIRHLADPSKLYNSARMIYKERMDELWGAMEAIPLDNLHTSEHGEKITVGNQTFQAWHTPGHASHHIAWQLEDTLFTGDVAGVTIDGGMVVPPCPPPDIDIEAWQNSIRLMRDLPVKTLQLTHFGAVTELDVHFDALEKCLQDWANWMKPHFDAQTPLDVITPLFQDYNDTQLREAGLSAETIAKYANANPAWMSVAGLMRYWKVRG
jgi:glyoxylase-like metal-dependent hydrolase (beta-lactamase superfamily II)